MIEGQAKGFEKELKTSPTITENIENPAALATDIKSATVLEIKVREIYQLNKRKKIKKLKSSRIL